MLTNLQIAALKQERLTFMHATIKLDSFNTKQQSFFVFKQAHIQSVRTRRVVNSVGRVLALQSKD